MFAVLTVLHKVNKCSDRTEVKNIDSPGCQAISQPNKYIYTYITEANINGIDCLCW